MGDKAVLVVSFGTSYKETREKTLEKIEKDFKKEFGGDQVVTAYTSQMIINKIKRTENKEIYNVSEAMEHMNENEIKSILVQPTHILNGQEYEKMLAMLEPYKKDFKEIIIGKPLLTDSKDYEKIADIMIHEIGEIKDDHVVVLMGHGTGHYIDAAYAALDYRFKAKGYDRIFVATVEGYPGLEDIEHRIAETGAKNITMIPFMVVAGDHATNDMAGDEDSWKTLMEAKGYSVNCILKGLGEYPEVRKMYIEHLKEAQAEKHNFNKY